MGKSPAQFMRELRKRRVEKGLCTRCGSKIKREGYHICQDCRNYLNEYDNNRTLKNEKTIIRKLNKWEITNEKLADALIKTKTTISELAEKVGVTYRTVERWIYQNGIPNKNHKIKINEILNDKIYKTD